MTAAAQQFFETEALEAQLEADAAFEERWIAEQRGREFSMQGAGVGRGEGEVEDESERQRRRGPLPRLTRSVDLRFRRG